MNKYLLLLFFSSLKIALYGQAETIQNAVALENGSRYISTPPSYTANSERSNLQKFSPDALLDLSSNVWCSREGSHGPFEFVIELAESFSLTRLEFDTRVENYQGIAAKDIRVEFSLKGPDKGYEDPLEYSLISDKVNSFNIEPVQARWVRLTVLSNHGNSKWTELNEFKAFGYPRHESIQQIDIGGVWETNWQMITFSQTKNQFTATYSYDKKNSAVINGKVINGRISRNRLEFQWEEKQLKGTAVLYMNEEGNLLSGKWWNDNRADDFGLWIMHRKEAKPIVNVVKEDSIRFGDQKIEIGKKIVLQNLLFVQSKAELVPGAELELDKLKRLLASNPNLKVELHGHTDNVGDPGKNQKLSEDRVEMVKNYLVSNGIMQRRISGKGYGGSQPVADNSNPETRKLNRRVEFVLF